MGEKIEFSGKVGAEYMTFMVDKRKKEFHSAYFTTVYTTDGRKLTLTDKDEPAGLVQGKTRYQALKKGKEFIKRWIEKD